MSARKSSATILLFFQICSTSRLYKVEDKNKYRNNNCTYAALETSAAYHYKLSAHFRFYFLSHLRCFSASEPELFNEPHLRRCFVFYGLLTQLMGDFALHETKTVALCI